MANWNWKDAVGKRALIKSYFFIPGKTNTYIPQEVRFLELSPSGEWIKVEYLEGEERRQVKWKRVGGIEIIEMLGD